jgi:D-psicose/D-tagatose/L-ribulose 3-epimerase
MRLRFKEHIDLAARLHAVVFLGLCRGKSPTYAERRPYLDRLAEEFLPLVEYAQGKGVILALEPIVFYLTNLLNTTEETLEFLRRPGLEPIQLLMDTHHMYIEDPDLNAAFRLCARAGAGKIAHVHLSDSNRRYPGSGKVDYAGMIKTLDELGYGGALSMEVLPYPSGEEAAKLGLAYMRSLL